jgi:hypothetical protein
MWKRSVVEHHSNWKQWGQQDQFIVLVDNLIKANVVSQAPVDHVVDLAW